MNIVMYLPKRPRNANRSAIHLWLVQGLFADGLKERSTLHSTMHEMGGFPAGSLVKNLPAGHAGSVPGLGTWHMPQSN